MPAFGKKPVYFTIILLVAIVSFPIVGFAQTKEQLQTRISQLEKQMQTMSRAVYRGEKMQQDPTYTPNYGQTTPTDSIQSTLANIEIRISDIEKQLRLTTGQMERYEYENRKLKKQLQNLGGRTSREHVSQNLQGLQLNQQLSSTTQPVKTATTLYAVPQQTKNQTSPTVSFTQTALKQPPEGFLGTLAVPTTNTVPDPISSTSNAVSTTSVMPPEQAYEQAYTHIRDGKYKDAATEFTNFLEKYPNNKLSANAQYWLAETYYVRGKYDDAAKLFARGYENYPKSSKTSDNLLKLGLSLSKNGNKRDACLTFIQLEKEFPNKTGMTMQRLKQEQKRLGCDVT